MTHTSQHDAAAAGSDAVTFDTSVASPARVWNYWIGGKDNYAADRAAAEAVSAANPAQPIVARTARRFLVDVVRRLAGEYGVRQFLDIGSGLPTADNTHEVAQRLAPDSRVVYVDNDPVVLAHARALLTSSPEGKTDFILADLRDPQLILTRAARTLDLSKPVAIVLVGVLHFITEEADPYAIVALLMAAAAPGSYLVIGHAASDVRSAAVQQGYRAYNARSPVMITPRNREQIDRFLVGLEPVGPGVVTLSQWFEPGQLGGDGAELVGYTGIMQKPR
ncbi:MAG: SAM-dependent methyltransferase [Streptosporangiaceae bacterium]